MRTLSHKSANASALKFVSEVFGAKWTLEILTTLRISKNPLRYTQIQLNLPGISPRMLSTRLSFLVNHGLISKIIDAHKPRKSKYRLSDYGRDFLELVDESLEWSEQGEICNEPKCEYH